MSLIELNIRFSTPQQFVVKFEDLETDALNFIQPFENKDFSDLTWYLETYASSYIADVDVDQANKIEQRLKELGEKLFNSIFSDPEARRIFNAFQDTEEKRLINISANHSTILSLPWELLREPKGSFLMNEKLSIRRRYAGAGGGKKFFKINTKEKLHLLFVVSRPEDVGFLNPRSEAQAVMQALREKQANVEIEFLRPATLDNLIKRLENEDLPSIDIVHFDGHGTFVENKDYQPRETAKETHESLVKEIAGNSGYLVFENERGEKDLVSAEDLGDALFRKKIGLVVLSACQSAKVGGEDALNSVAARLTHVGLPAVLAMTYSVLVATTEKLFGEFYANLMQGKYLGESLDNSRRYLDRNDQRGERQCGQDRIILKLKDWFVPVLYQASGDQALLNKHSPRIEPFDFKENHNLPDLQEAGFIGRSKELWEIERNFVKKTRRITITGFGGQGKTYLAIEAGLWLLQTGFFERVCFISYAGFQGINAVDVALSALRVVLKESFVDNQAFIHLLKKTKTLIIFDNLESLAAEELQSLLTVAKEWSETGESRLLITTRTPDLKHSDYSKQSFKHRYLPLNGLYSEDALKYFQKLQQLGDPPNFAPPSREVLLRLFEKVAFHPLSISLLAHQLKIRRPAELGECLEQLLNAIPPNEENKSLLASLNLSLDRLNPQHLDLVKYLGVFQGGAMEIMVLEVTEMEKTVWNELKMILESSGLIQVEDLSHLGAAFSYLKFHPTLAPALWQQPTSEQQAFVLNRYVQAYYELSEFLYVEDNKNVHVTRAIAWRELPNLLHAVNLALNNTETFTVKFVSNINWFLNFFSLNKDRVLLTQRAEPLSGDIGSDDWFLIRRDQGEQLYQLGHYDQAVLIFQDILKNLLDSNSYECCVALHKLGRCFGQQGNTSQAITCYQQSLAIAQRLQFTYIEEQIEALHSDLADAFRDSRNFEQATLHYEQSLVIAKDIGDYRQQVVANFQMGTLAMLQGKFAEAEQRYQTTLQTARCLQEPAQEAIVWHQLGVAYQQATAWAQAEHAYRQSASIKETQGNLMGAANTWNNLGLVAKAQGKLEAAESWHRKTIEVRKQGNPKELAKSLNNLADLLQNQPSRLKEAQQIAEQALAIRKTLDEASAEIWTTYNILAEIVDKQQLIENANNYRQQSRDSYFRFAGMPYEMKQHANLIGFVLVALQDAEQRQELEMQLQQFSENWQKVVKVIEKILDGERNETQLLEPLNYEEAAIVHFILQGIENPDSIAFLFSNE